MQVHTSFGCELKHLNEIAISEYSESRPGLNILLLDWYDCATFDFLILGNYEKAVANVPKAAQVLSEYIPELQDKNLLDLTNTNLLVGFSLGTQLAGQYLKQSGVPLLKRITGLDPAGPEYNADNQHVDTMLDSTDAGFVDV